MTPNGDNSDEDSLLQPLVTANNQNEDGEYEEEPVTWKKTCKSIFVTPWTNFVTYYFAQMIVSGASLAAYGVMSFQDRIPCKVEDGSNPTGVLSISFIIGFSLLAVSFIVSTFVEPILRATLRRKVYEEGENSETRRLFVFGFVVEHLFRVLFLAFSVY